MSKKFIAELIGTAILVLFGCGSAVIAGSAIGFTGLALAFGLSIVAAAYGIGAISGAHLNPAVSFGMVAAGRMSVGEAVQYAIAQIIGAILGAGILYLIASGKAGNTLATNGVGYNGSDDFAWQLACAMRRIGCTATLFRPDMGTEGNELLHLREHGEPASLELVDIEQRPEETHLYITSLRAFVPRV